jgi:hypothetical protein
MLPNILLKRQAIHMALSESDAPQVEMPLVDSHPVIAGRWNKVSEGAACHTGPIDGSFVIKDGCPLICRSFNIAR